jgi:hypothetical protein
MLYGFSHFDQSFWPDSESDIGTDCRFRKNILASKRIAIFGLSFLSSRCGRGHEDRGRYLHGGRRESAGLRRRNRYQGGVRVRRRAGARRGWDRELRELLGTWPQLDIDDPEVWRADLHSFRPVPGLLSSRAGTGSGLTSVVSEGDVMGGGVCIPALGQVDAGVRGVLLRISHVE